MKTRKNLRLKEYDYSKEGLYFITICTKNRERILSQIDNVGADDSVRPENIKIKNLKIGNEIERIWKYIEKIYDNVIIDKYIIMPNHIHGIIKIKDGRTESSAPT